MNFIKGGMERKVRKRKMPAWSISTWGSSLRGEEEGTGEGGHKTSPLLRFLLWQTWQVIESSEQWVLVVLLEMKFVTFWLAIWLLSRVWAIWGLVTSRSLRSLKRVCCSCSPPEDKRRVSCPSSPFALSACLLSGLQSIPHSLTDQTSTQTKNRVVTSQL